MDAQTVIVGAGPAGALLAYLLSSRGIDTLLIERQSDFGREFRGELLMPSGLRALADAEVSLDPVATSTPTLVEGRLNGRTILSVDTSAFDPPQPTAVSQPELLEELVRLAEATGHFELRRGTGVRGVDRDAKGALSLRVRDSKKDQDESLRASLIIGADGRSSIIRRRLDPKVENRSTPLDVVWFKIPYPAHWAGAQARFEAGHGHLMIAVRTPDNLLQAAWVIVKGTYGDLKSRSIQDWAGIMADHTDPRLGAHLRAHSDQITRPFLLDAVADCVQGWSEPGALLIGDAAHTMSPVGGQGINLALRDAIVAANQLVPALRKGGEQGQEVDAAAATIEGLRAPEINRIQRLAALPPRVVMGRTFAHEILRRALGRIAGTRIGQARGGRFASLFLNGVTKVELRV